MSPLIIEIVESPIKPSAYPPASGAGAVVEFSGIVRDLEEGVPIRGIEYEAFREMALAELERIGSSMVEKYELTECVCVHRVGFVAIQEAAVYIRTSAEHREPAYAANMEFIENLKRRVPIWKHPVGATSVLDDDCPGQ